MKIREGFVSNSSSSSFIVALDHRPKNIEDLMEMMYPGAPPDYMHPYKYADVYNDGFIGRTVKDICKDVIYDIPPDSELLKSISNALDGWFPVAPDFDEFENDKGDVDWDAYNKASDRYKDEYAEKVKKKYKSKFVFGVEYADDDGRIGSFMEHSNIFCNVPSERISNH